MFLPTASTSLVTLCLMKMCFPFVHFRLTSPLSLPHHQSLCLHLRLINLWMLHMPLRCFLIMLQVLDAVLGSSSLMNRSLMILLVGTSMCHA